MTTVTPAAAASSPAGLFVIAGSMADTARKLITVGDVAHALPSGRAAWNLLGGLPEIATVGRPQWGPQDFADHAVALCRPVVFMPLDTPPQVTAACVMAAVTTVVGCIHSLPGDDGVKARLADLEGDAASVEAIYRGIVEPAR